MCGATTAREISKVSQRLVKLERDDGVPEPRLAIRVAALLGIEMHQVRRLIDEMRMEERHRYERWLNESVPLEMHVIPFAGFSYRHQLPDCCDELEAFRLAKQMTNGRDMRVIVAVSRRLSFVFQRGQLVDRLDVSAGDRVVPVVQIGKSFIQFETE
jgi:hypothetical protein